MIEQFWLDNDSLENYLPKNSGKSNYTQNEISYLFNSDKFRCDEFDSKNYSPVVFMGCSFTEGSGLPLNELWSYHFYKKICEKSIKNIPYWCLAKGGASVDYCARVFYEYGKKLKPKYIVYLLSGISRREYMFDNNEIHGWFPNPSIFLKKSNAFKTVSPVFVNSNFALYQTKRSLMILNSVAEQIDSEIFIFDIDNMDNVNFTDKVNLFSEFNRINYFINFMHTQYDVPENIKQRPLKARDNSHPGAYWQYQVYSNIWEILKTKIEF